jgi:predicted O-linked N-acetylglucosamine transferase (SPINDLY family)
MMTKPGVPQTNNGLLAKLAEADKARQDGRLADAERLYEDALKQNPHNFEALHQLGVVNLRLGNNGRGADYITRALHADPNSAPAHSNLGFALCLLNRPAEALAHFDRAIALKPDYAEAHNNRAHALFALRKPEDALVSANRALALKPDYGEAQRNRANAIAAIEQGIQKYDEALASDPGQVEIHYNRGNHLIALKRYEEAIASFDCALKLRPDHLKAQNNRGAALIESQRFEEAVAAFDAVLALNPNSAAAHSNRAHALNALRRHEEALTACELAIALSPNYVEALNIRGNALNALRRHEEALQSYARVIALKPDYAEAIYNSGVALSALKKHPEALAQYDRAIALNPEYARAHANRAATLVELRQLAEAQPSYERALTLGPDIEFLFASYLYNKMKLCNWRDIEAQKAELVRKTMEGTALTSPFIMLAISDSLDVQRKAAELYADYTQPRDGLLEPPKPRATARKIRIGYFSATFHDHAAALWVSEMFEKHDRARFELTGISFGPDRKDHVRKRLEASFDQFHDLREKSEKEIAQFARDLGIDIAVDLMGYTEDGRPNVFVHRAAPVQVSYMGYPGTMGTSRYDYLIADRTLIPPDQRERYSEKIVTMPNTYMANDTKRPISKKLLSREDAGLPEKAFVFCCFNNNFKIAPETFDLWMRILKRVDGSVLWLLQDNPSAAVNLRKEAAARGIDPARLIFAPRVPLPDHLARHRLADLFLDTMPYNAHTTASDALWLGLPVLTLIGQTFVSRVAASVLSAIRLTELITATEEEFENLAVELSTDRNELARIKDKLAATRITAPLFDIALFTRHIEKAYEIMLERFRAGIRPDHFDVPADA